MANVVAQGGTITLNGRYEDGLGDLVDPVSPSVRIIDPDDNLFAGPFTPVRDSLGLYHYTYTVGASDDLGHWAARFQGTVSGAPVSGDENFTVTLPGAVIPAGGDLITLAELKTALGIPLSNTSRDARYSFAISAASTAIRNYTDRDFGVAEVTQQRTYDYDPSGCLDVDDCRNVTLVIVSQGSVDYTVPVDQWRGMPTAGPVFSYIELLGSYGYGSPEMGFKRNVDVYAAEGRFSYFPAQVKVTATYGWPTVPDDVKQAAVYTASTLAEKPEAIQSESIAGYSYTLAIDSVPYSIPFRAKELLDAYARIKA